MKHHSSRRSTGNRNTSDGGELAAMHRKAQTFITCSNRNNDQLITTVELVAVLDVKTSCTAFNN